MPSPGEAPRRTRCSTATDPTQNPAGPRAVHRPICHPPAANGVDDTPVPVERPDHTPQVRGYPMKLEGPTYLVPGDAVESVDHVQRHGQCHATTLFDPLDQGTDTGDSVGRRPPPPKAKLAVVQSENTSRQMRLEAGSYHSLQ